VRLGRCLFDAVSGRLLLAHDGSEIALTAMELDLLRTMLRHRNMILPRYRLSELAHGIADGHGGRGIDARLLRLRRKIEIDPAQPQHLRTLRGEGYQLVLTTS
jgi:two-component system phosphate regulon response regulator OmpR